MCICVYSAGWYLLTVKRFQSLRRMCRKSTLSARASLTLDPFSVERQETGTGVHLSLPRSLTHSPTHSLIHSLNHSLTHSHTYSLTHLFTHSSTNSLTLIHSLSDKVVQGLLVTAEEPSDHCTVKISLSVWSAWTV